MRSAAEVEAELENVRLEDPVDRVFAALLYLELGNVKQALRSVHGGESLEEIAISVLGLLKVDRVDLAEKTLAKMTEVDDDDTIVQLAKAWVNLHKGFGKQSEKVQDVLDSIHEMIEKNGKTAFLLELLAATEIRNGNYSEAIKILKEARSTAISTGVKPGTATLFNTLVTLNHLDPNTARSSDQPGLFDHVKDELKKTYPNHPYFEKISALESLFDRSGSRYSS
jgi:tetratricopeptide (TPR) repeat protein